MKDTQIIPDEETEMEMRIEDTRIDLMLALLNGSASRWLPSILVAHRAERIADRAINYIYYEDE